MKTLTWLFGSFACVVALSGCASKFYVPGNRFMSPEAGGGLLKGDVKTGLYGVTDIQVADDISSSAPDTTPKLIKNTSFGLGLQLGLLERLDMYLNAVARAPGFAGIKIQVIGDSAQNAKAGNFSLALAGGLALKSNLKTTIETTAVRGESTIEPNGWEAMVLIGYRPYDSALVYVSPFVTHVTANVKVQRTENWTTTVTAEPNGQGDMRGVSLGFRLGSTTFLNGEASITNTKWTREDPISLTGNDFSDIALGLATGFAW